MLCLHTICDSLLIDVAPSSFPGCAHNAYEDVMNTLCHEVTMTAGAGVQEVNIVLSGTGEVRTRVANGTVVTTPFPTNTTSVAPARVVYQMANVGKGDMQLLVVMGCSYPTITMYSDWTDMEGKLVKPMFWDNSCPTTLPPAVARLIKTPQPPKPEGEL